MNVLVRVLGLEEQQLGHDQVGHVVLDRPDDEDHALLEQARVDVERALATRSLLDHHGDQVLKALRGHSLSLSVWGGQARLKALLRYAACCAGFNSSSSGIEWSLSF